MLDKTQKRIAALELIIDELFENIPMGNGELKAFTEKMELLTDEHADLVNGLAKEYGL